MHHARGSTDLHLQYHESQAPYYLLRVGTLETTCLKREKIELLVREFHAASKLRP